MKILMTQLRLDKKQKKNILVNIRMLTVKIYLLILSFVNIIEEINIVLTADHRILNKKLPQTKAIQLLQ